MKLTRVISLMAAATVASQMANWKISAADPQTAAATAPTLAKKDITFMNEAAKAGVMEIHMGELAQQKGQAGDVKAFGQRLVADHTKANDELKQLATSKGVTLPIQHGENHQKQLDKLSNSSDFDKTFKEMAIKDHKKAIKEFEKASKHAEDAELKSWATKTLPTLQVHLRMAEQLGTVHTAQAR